MKATGALSRKVHRDLAALKSASELWVRNHPSRVEGSVREEAWVPALTHRAVLLLLWGAPVLPSAQWVAWERTSSVSLGSTLGFGSVPAPRAPAGAGCSPHCWAGSERTGLDRREQALLWEQDLWGLQNPLFL